MADVNPVTGTEVSNVLDGTSGNDLIKGLGGNDTINPGLGDNDTVDAGGGVDTLVVDYSASTTAITLDGLAQTGASLAGYPSPGGTTFSSTGNFRTGTRDANYTITNLSEVNSLWWGATVGAALDNAIDTAGETMTLSPTFTNDGKTAIWTGTTTAITTSGNQTIYTRFTMTLDRGRRSWDHRRS